MKDEKLVIKPRRPKGEDGYKTFSVRVQDEVVAQIDKIATRTGRSRNELIGTFLKYALDNCTIEE